MSLVGDTDYLGTIDLSGSVSHVYDKDAITQAIIMYITAPIGAVPRGFSKGGILEFFLFQPITEETSADIRVTIVNGLKNDFTPTVITEAIDVIMDKSNKRYIINLRAYCPQYDQNIETSLKVDALV